MIRWLVMWCIALIAMGGEIDQKLVLGGDADLQKAEVKLYQAKILFLENSQLQKLKKNHHLSIKIEIEQVMQYHLVVVSPITSKDLREKLAIYGASYYPDLLFIDSQNSIVPILNINQPLNHPYTMKTVLKSLINTIGLGVEWIAIFLLSVFGLILSLYRRRMMSSIQDDQDEMIKKEVRIEKEIQSLEV